MTPTAERKESQTPNIIDVPFSNRSSRFVNTAKLTAARDPRFMVRGLQPDQVRTLNRLADAKVYSELHEEVPFENPTITAEAASISRLPEKVSFGNSQYRTELTGVQLEELLDAWFGGKITHPELRDGIEQTEKILGALRSTRTVVLRFDL